MLDALYERDCQQLLKPRASSSQHNSGRPHEANPASVCALFAHGAGAHYFGCAEKAGKANARIGLSPQWDSGAMPACSNPSCASWQAPSPMYRGKIATLIKLALLDMEIAAETCFAAEALQQGNGRGR